MAWGTISTAVTGDIVPAAYGNRIRDSVHYLKGQAGEVNIENTMTVATSVSTNTFIATGPLGEVRMMDRDGTDYLSWYASTDRLRAFWGGASSGDRFSIGSDGSLALVDMIDNAIQPGHLSRAALAGFLRAGQWTYAYNGDGTIASQVMNAAGPLTGGAITYEYTGGLVAAVRLRTGGAAGTIIQNIVYTYDGTGRIATEMHS